MICPRCSVAEISPETNTCVLCGYAAGAATAPPVEGAMPATETRLDPIAREELAQLFHIERAVDSGGLVTTYLAREVETERRVVLRTLPWQPVRDAGLEDQLLRELATAASLDHPHIVPLYRYGATLRYVWYSGKHVSGQSLAELLHASGPLELHASLRVVEQIASALQYAHRRGVVHADVRPANVRLDPSGWSLLTGFAVGRFLDRLPLTVLGGRPIRRPESIAPEERYSRQPSPAADQYSLAVLVYECLTGSLPFDGMSSDDVLPLALTGPYPDIPEHVQVGLRRALSVRPSDRFESILEFVSALESEDPRPSQPVEMSRPSGPGHLPATTRALPAPQRADPERPRASPAPGRVSPVPAQASPVPGRVSPVPGRVSPAPGRASPAPSSADAVPGRAHPVPGTAAAQRPSTNTTVLLIDQPGRWPRAAKWIVALGLLVAAGMYGPGLWRQWRDRPARVAAPIPSEPPRQVVGDSGLGSPPPADAATRAQAALDPPVEPPPPTPPVVATPRPTARRTPVVTTPRPTPEPVRQPPAATAPARLFVNATPWGQVFVDGQLVGNTPQANLGVPAGVHRVRVAREGFHAFERVVQLAPGQELRLTDIVLQAIGP